MLSLNEFKQIQESAEELMNVLDDPSILDKASYYDIEEDDQTLETTVTLYDEAGAALCSVKVDDYDVAETYLEEYFDLEEMDHEDRDADAAAVGSRYGHNA
jgi:uncharacterized protein YacL (UPF0231 family)